MGTMKPKHLLFFGHSPALHGAEYSLLRLITQLQSSFQVSVCAPSGGAFEQKVRELNLDFYPSFPQYPFSLKHEKRSRLPHFTRQLQREHQRLNETLPPVDLIHSNTFYVWEGAMIAATRGIPHVWNPREIPQTSPTWDCSLGWSHTFELVRDLSDHIVCVSDALRSKLPEHSQNKASTVHNGLDPKTLWNRDDARKWMSDHTNIPADAKVALTIGNFIPEKGHQRLLDIATPLLSQHPQWHLLWVGEHHFCYEGIREQIDALGLQDRIHCPGPVPQMGQKIKLADLYLLPSLTEAFPTVLLEAGLGDVPFICSDCGGSKEIAARGGGHCLEHWDEVREVLEQAFQERWQAPPRDQSAFTMDAMAQGYQNVYMKAIEQGVDAQTQNLRLSAQKRLFDLHHDLQHAARALDKIDRLKALRGLGRFFRWYF